MWANPEAYGVIHGRKSKTKKFPSSCHDGVGVNGGIAPLIFRSGARLEWSASRTRRFITRPKATVPIVQKEWWVPRLFLNLLKRGKFRKKVTCSYRESNPCSSVVRPTASYRTAQHTRL